MGAEGFQMPKPVNFAVLGLGMGMHHCRAILASQGAHLTAVCDHDPKRLSAAVKEFGVDGFAMWSDMLKADHIDAICVATESATHTTFGVQAARKGKHLLMEKPVDVSLSRINKLQAEVAKAGVKCGCVYQYRVDPCNIAIRKAIQTGKMGRVIGAHIRLPWLRLNEYYQGPHGRWRGTWKMDGGGSLSNQGIHSVDLLQWLVGPVESVCGYYGVFNHRIEAEDQAVAILKFKSGALGTLLTTTCAIPDQAMHTYIYGTKGSFSRKAEKLEFYEMGTPKERERMMKQFGGREEKNTAGVNALALSSDGHTVLIEDLVKAIRKDADPLIPIQSAAESVRIVKAIYQSARSGREVQIDRVKA